MLTIPGPEDKQEELSSVGARRVLTKHMEELPNPAGSLVLGRLFLIVPQGFSWVPQSCSARGERQKDSGISGTYPLYCHWRWIFLPLGLALDGGGLSGSLQKETTPSSLVTKPVLEREVLPVV